MLAVTFAVVFFALKRTYPTLRGINTIAFSFLLGIPGTFLVASHGLLPQILTVTLAYCFVFGSFIFLYRGILRFLGTRRTSLVPVFIACIALAILFYYSQVQQNIIPRILAISLTIGLVRGLIAVELFRKSPTFPSPRAMRLFAACMSFFAAVTVYGGVMTVLHGSPAGPLTTNGAGTAALFVGVISACLTGLFVLILASSEMIARSRDESQKDSLSGAFNRRGIEAKLAFELKQIQRGKSKLSVALIDVDYFKSINDIQGHAAGDDALRDVAETISRHLRAQDYLGRYGGDEFLLVLPHTPCGVALAVTERLNLEVASCGEDDGSMPLTLSIGLTEAVPGDDARTLIERADKALYQAKSDGRNCRRVLHADHVSHSAQKVLMDTPLGAMIIPPVTGNSVLQRSAANPIH